MVKTTMGLMTAEQAEKKWGISNRQVQKLCSNGKIPHAKKFGTSWAIPSNVKKPLDGRTSKAKASGLFRLKVD